MYTPKRMLAFFPLFCKVENEIIIGTEERYLRESDEGRMTDLKNPEVRVKGHFDVLHQLFGQCLFILHIFYVTFFKRCVILHSGLFKTLEFLGLPWWSKV